MQVEYQAKNYELMFEQLKQNGIGVEMKTTENEITLVLIDQDGKLSNSSDIPKWSEISSSSG